MTGSNKKEILDFICIGAAKSATTTLHTLIKNHPDIFVPKVKEVPYFSDDKVYKHGLQRYMRAHFANANPTQLRGTLTPQYMIGQGVVTPDIVAKRIHKDMPEAKIIALLRHPVERAFSHYRMLCRNGYETRTFDQAVDDILKGNITLKNYDDPDCNYVLGSEYGKVLQEYYNLFPKEQILILTTNQLKLDPVGTLEELFTFLGVDKSYRPENTHQESRKGGGKSRIKYLTPGFVYRIPLIKKLWRKFVPQPIRKRVEYTVNLWNTVPDNEKLDKTSVTYKRLVKYFEADTKLLNSLTNKQISWKD